MTHSSTSFNFGMLACQADDIENSQADMLMYDTEQVVITDRPNGSSERRFQPRLGRATVVLYLIVSSSFYITAPTR
jgi:hypothetical protein